MLCKIVLHLLVMTTLCALSAAQCVLSHVSCPMEHLFCMAPIVNLIMSHGHFGESESMLCIYI